MIEYTPNTLRVRDRYRRCAELDGSNDPDPGAAFDRWLAEHDAALRKQIAGEVLEQGGYYDMNLRRNIAAEIAGEHLTPLSTLGLNLRIINALRWHASSVEQLLTLTEGDLRDIRGIGVNAMRQIKAALDAQGLTISGGWPDWLIAEEPE